ncbi:hypothetical protein OIU77_004403 [Salix suchowensis]|uniref:Zinc finger PHD-type domain-containing protein n=1 Tax=Salix suchowensis TaxID=1278906 RepID=A0ABQ9AWC1_9ROSI|nr:hypothetical protein OIU77_004403 [Salix suchowensis]
MRQKVRMRAESGTCNVCSAPCSSCMHLKLACMGSKGDEFSDETCRVTASSQYSNNDDDGDGIVPFKSRALHSLQHTTSEASNLLSVSSSHDSLSENAESKANIRASDADASAESQMLPKLSSGRAVAEDHISPKPQCLSDQKTLSKKHGVSKSEEGHDDTVSCVSRASDARKVVHYPKKNLDRNNLLCSSDLEVEGSGKALFSHNSGSLETPSNDVDAGSGSPKVQIKCLSLNANGKCFNEHPSLHDPGKPFECPVEQVNLSLSKEAACNIDCGGNLAAHDNVDNHANGKSTINAESSKISCKIYSKLEPEADKDSGDQSDEGFKGSEQVGLEEKLNGLDELAEMQEPPLQPASLDDSDESEILEHDVKVCDICGDAGREDLLAICSRCTDGAEHTYCMREMLQKAPEGDWLCEECKLAEETGNQKQDAEEKRMNSTQSSGKRQAGTIELVSVPKRQATESSLASPKSCSPSRIAAVSRDTSFKSLDKGKVKIAHQTSFGNRFSIDIRETSHPSLNGARVQTPKGTLLKSNSFNTGNSQPKVKLVNEFPQKHKGTRESSLDMKERPARMMSKSMSFKSVNSGRPVTIESKVKMVSSKLSHIQDARGIKQVKDQNAVDRKNLLRLDRPFGSSMPNSAVVSTPKLDQRITPRGESAIASSTSMNKELKSTQSDGKLGTLSRSASSVGRKSADIPGTSARVSSTPGSSSASVEQKSNQISPKDEPSSSSWNAERLYNNANENMQDGLPQSRESSTQGEKVRESSVSHLRPTGTTGLKIVTCQKCKEVGHATENCTAVSPMTPGTDVPASRTAREGMSKDSKLKAAIEAAMLKRPGIYRKKKESDQSDGVPLLNVDAGSEIQDRFSVLNKMNEGTLEGQVNLGVSSSEFCKSANINNVKQLNEHSTDTVCLSKAGQLDSTAPYMGKPAHSVEQSALVKMSAIPEHEYIWQGAFEVHRSEKFIDLYGGIQAHLSTCASPKVHDMVNKFPQNINLDEVPRLSTWPRQFKISGAKEENIALYFFAKDFESYENYKGLLDIMIKKDLALKGSFDGVELFIFPSTQLPENSQRWNMLYFLWGVFRGRRSDSNSFEKLVIPSLNVVPRDKDIPAAVLSSLENVSSSECNAKETSACDSSCDVPLTSNAPEKPCVPLNGISYNKVFNSQMIQEKQDGKYDSKSMPTPWCPEVRRSSSSMVFFFASHTTYKKTLIWLILHLGFIYVGVWVD